MDFIRWGSRLMRAIQQNTSVQIKCCPLLLPCMFQITVRTCAHIRDTHQFCASLGPNQAPVKGKKKKDVFVCVSLLSVTVVYTNILNLLPKRTHKRLRCTINHPPNPLVFVDGGSVWFHPLRSSMWLPVRLYKTTIFLQFITRFPGN